MNKWNDFFCDEMNKSFVEEIKFVDITRMTQAIHPYIQGLFHEKINVIKKVSISNENI